MDETRQGRTQLGRINSDKSLAKDSEKEKDMGIFESLRARMRLRLDTDDILLRKAHSCPALPTTSPYSEFFMYEFSD